MRLHDIDDLPFHQQPTPFDQAATSDPHFNDGYFFGFMTEGWYFIAGLRLHPNMNTVDGFACATHDGEQQCVRFSRALRPRYTDLSVGPFTLEVLEKMQRQRLVLTENPGGIEFDVELTAQAPPFVETRYQHVRYGRLINDTLRYNQVIRANGTAKVNGEILAVDSWWGLRDHSWGIRSSMGPRTKFGGVDKPADEQDERAYRLWVPFDVGDHTGFFHTHENRSGEPLDFEGRLDFPDGKSVGLRGVNHKVEYHPGTRWVVGGSFELIGDDGSVRSYRFSSGGTPADVQGGGYYGGWLDGGSAGVYRGPETVEQSRYRAAADAQPSGPDHIPPDKRWGPTEFPVVISCDGGGQGMAHFEHAVFGAYEPYGFS
jgi:hypothetical protein